IALRKVLRKAHHGVVDGLVTVRMVLAHHVANNVRAFLERRGGIESQSLHGEQEPPMHGLQPIAGIRQRAARNGGQRILEIPPPQGSDRSAIFSLPPLGGGEITSLPMNRGYGAAPPKTTRNHPR